MKRKNIDILLVAILVICTIVLYVVQNNTIVQITRIATNKISIFC